MYDGPFIAKENLRDGAYYKGTCRNAEVARWNGAEETFYHYRYKFGTRFIECIRCPEDEQRYDVFFAIEEIETPDEEISFI